MGLRGEKSRSRPGSKSLAVRRSTRCIHRVRRAGADEFLSQERKLKYVTLVAAVAYLGIYKSQLLSIVNIFGVMSGNLPSSNTTSAGISSRCSRS